jgi:hypothetical protein
VGRSRGCTRNEVFYPAELNVGLNTFLSRGPRSLLVAHQRPGVESPRTCPPPHRPTRAPSRGSSVQRGRGCPPGGPPWGSHAPVAWAPIHFRPLFAAHFRASPRARAGPNTAAVKDEGVSLSSKLSRAQHAVILLPDSRHAAVAASSSMSSLHMPGISHIVMLCTQAVGVGPMQAAERPADLAPVRFNC